MLLVRYLDEQTHCHCFDKQQSFMLRAQNKLQGVFHCLHPVVCKLQFIVIFHFMPRRLKTYRSDPRDSSYPLHILTMSDACSMSLGLQGRCDNSIS